jgi:hypothetical protein
LKAPKATKPTRAIWSNTSTTPSPRQKALGLTFLDDWELPDENGSDIGNQYRKFRTEVDHYSVQIQIAHIRQGPKNSVGLNDSEKKHLRAYADAIKAVIDQSDLVAAKKDRLYDKINAFIAELDRERMPLQKFHDIVMSLATTGAEAADKLEPAWKWVRLGAELLGVRQETEQQKLPAPPKLEGPKRQLPPPPKKVNGSRRDMGDDIPF